MATPLHSTPLYCTLHYFTCFYFNLPYLTSLHFTSLHFSSLHFTSLHFTSLHFTSLHFTSLHCTSLRFASLHFTLLCFILFYFILFYKRCAENCKDKINPSQRLALTAACKENCLGKLVYTWRLYQSRAATAGIHHDKNRTWEQVTDILNKASLPVLVIDQDSFVFDFEYKIEVYGQRMNNAPGLAVYNFKVRNWLYAFVLSRPCFLPRNLDFVDSRV